MSIILRKGFKKTYRQASEIDQWSYFSLNQLRMRHKNHITLVKSVMILNKTLSQVFSTKY